MTDLQIAVSLGTTVVAMAGYIAKLHTADRKDRKEMNAEIKEINAVILSVVKTNTEAFHELKATVTSNTKATDAMHRMVSDYIRHPH